MRQPQLRPTLRNGRKGVHHGANEKGSVEKIPVVLVIEGILGRLGGPCKEEEGGNEETLKQAYVIECHLEVLKIL